RSSESSTAASKLPPEDARWAMGASVTGGPPTGNVLRRLTSGALRWDPLPGAGMSKIERLDRTTAAPGVRSLPRAIYAVADRNYFIGAVALLNSLRLVGHDEPLFLIDAGLTPAQRQLLAPHVRLVAAPEG